MRQSWPIFAELRAAWWEKPRRKIKKLERLSLKKMREIDVEVNLAEGVPRSFTMNSDEILEALQEPLSIIVEAVKSALEQCPRSWLRILLKRDCHNRGGALLRDLDVL